MVTHRVHALIIGSLLFTRAGILLLALIATLSLFAQQPLPKRAWADSVFGTLENTYFADRSRTLELLDRMNAVYALDKDSCRQARVGSWRANCFDGLGQLDSAMTASQQALSLFHSGCDSIVLMSINVNLTNTLLSLGEFKRTLSICDASLAAWNDRWPYTIARNGLYTNRAIALANLGDMPGALEAFREVLANARNEGVVQNEIDALANLGALFGMMSDQGRNAAYLDSSSVYLRQTLRLVRSIGDREGTMRQYSNLAGNAQDRGRYREALAYLDSTYGLASELHNRSVLSKVAQSRARNYRSLGLLDSAYVHLERHIALKDSLLNTEKVKAIADVQEKYESEKKAKEILGLRADNLEGELEQVRVKRTRNIYLFSAIAVVGLAIALWSRLRFVHRSRAAIQKEKDISEGLLLNILPSEVAEELKRKGFADAREFDKATIVFTDFKGFTALSELLTAAQLVAEIDHCFKAFDGIMGKYRIEKIKTIGDAYMAAGGLPDPAHGAPADVVHAALEMQVFMLAYGAERKAQGRPHFEMRVGVHTGPVIAGIVGVKKFAYDIWGDTVNTASRMESSGEVGKVNISEATYDLVKDVSTPNGTSAFKFTSRGKVQAKGKGEMEMYFAEQA